MYSLFPQNSEIKFVLELACERILASVLRKYTVTLMLNFKKQCFYLFTQQIFIKAIKSTGQMQWTK